MSEIAAALPLQIICDMLGIPESDYHWVFEKTNVVLGAGDPEYGEEITAAFLAAQKLCSTPALRRPPRASPHDITTAISRPRSRASFTAEEFGSFFVLLVVAGNETASSAISDGMLALTDNPAEKRRWLDDYETSPRPRSRRSSAGRRRSSTSAGRPRAEDVELGGQRSRRPEDRPLVQLGEPR